MRPGVRRDDAAADPRRIVLARVVCEALLEQDVVGPGALPRDRERGRAYPLGVRPESSSIVRRAARRSSSNSCRVWVWTGRCASP